MEKQKIKYVSGLRIFPPAQGQADFMVAQLIVTPSELAKWMKENPDYLSEHKGNAQIRVDIFRDRSGALKMRVNDYQTAAAED